jgi:ribosomal protein L7/L12
MNSSVMEKFHRRLMADGDLDGALRVLRDGGYSKIQSMKALADTGRFGLAEAKAVVHGSAVWEDTRQRDSEFHEALEAEVKKSEPPQRD